MDRLVCDCRRAYLCVYVLVKVTCHKLIRWTQIKTVPLDCIKTVLHRSYVRKVRPRDELWGKEIRITILVLVYAHVWVRVTVNFSLVLTWSGFTLSRHSSRTNTPAKSTKRCYMYLIILISEITDNTWPNHLRPRHGHVTSTAAPTDQKDDKDGWPQLIRFDRVGIWIITPKPLGIE